MSEVCFNCGAEFGPRISRADWPFPLCIFCWAEDQKHRPESERIAAEFVKRSFASEPPTSPPNATRPHSKGNP